MDASQRPLTIGVISLSFDNSIEDFISGRIKTSKSIPTFHELTSGDLNAFSPPGHWDGVILVHPASEGRLSLTDVTDARYNRLIPTLNKKYGTNGVLIVCYLLQNVKQHTQEMRLHTVLHSQPLAGKMTSRIIFCESLYEMFDEDVKHLQSFVRNLWFDKTKNTFNETFPVVDLAICDKTKGIAEQDSSGENQQDERPPATDFWKEFKDTVDKELKEREARKHETKPVKNKLENMKEIIERKIRELKGKKRTDSIMGLKDMIKGLEDMDKGLKDTITGLEKTEKALQITIKGLENTIKGLKDVIKPLEGLEKGAENMQKSSSY